MLDRSWGLIVLAALSLAPLSTLQCAQPQPPETKIRVFNEVLRMATTRIDTDALLALWEEGGVMLLPEVAPIVGKPAIARYLRDVTTSLGRARMLQFDFNCFDVVVSGAWASEWCTEHQIVDLGTDKPPFEGSGKILVVLHYGADRQWRLLREMWNQAPAKE